MDEPVLLTGAGGAVGKAILEGIGDAYEWKLMFHSPPAEEPDHEYLVGDVITAEDVESAVEGVGAVIHLAGDPRPEAPWDSVLSNNIDGTKKMYEAAVEEGVEKFVYASSNHAVGAFETDRRTPEMYRADDDFLLDGSEFPRPGNLYGVSKATGEVLGRYYHDEYGIDVCNIRIGNLTRGHPPIDYERGQAMWLSYRDCANIHACALDADYDFEIVYGISDNDRKYYSIERAKDVLGYDPQDNSAHFDGEDRVVERDA
ncbi:NAD-dependent glucose-6-phosphate dehydrogenase Azf [Haloarcula nitratireducens]|uniref:NAD-dependent glucose-6-phosphate dehydrogenase n=1 Tax=Haloarcula nitratireducens TaxID=2487749 RepID=A0AAW4PCI7_9EURY|nr:NAD-dependent glucose-6-phosphate dehydrogenase Azf [Halomicroarcula nitratireducens]MBX0295421.1 NAD(P)-dependent oxidoreductase [Halomicroarcula nitratireducens]